MHIIRSCNTFIMTISLILFIAQTSLNCYASDSGNSEEAAGITLDNVVLSEDSYYTKIKLIGCDRQIGRVTVQQIDNEGLNKNTFEYLPAAEVNLEIPYSDDLKSVIITWKEENGGLVCDPVPLELDTIYAADWQALATAIHRMDHMYGGKVIVEDGSKEYSSGRLIVKTRESIPDISKFDVAMIVIDDENHYFLQFEKSGNAKECAEYLTHQDGVEYVEIDTVVTTDE